MESPEKTQGLCNRLRWCYRIECCTTWGWVYGLVSSVQVIQSTLCYSLYTSGDFLVVSSSNAGITSVSNYGVRTVKGGESYAGVRSCKTALKRHPQRSYGPALEGLPINLRPSLNTS